MSVLEVLKDKLYIHTLPSYANKIFYGLGFLTLTSFVLLVLSGITLSFMGQSWWLVSPWGIYVRSVHLWSVQAFLAFMVLHMCVGFVTSGFKPPRRAVWALGALIFCLALIQTEFGYGLRGDFSSQFRAVSGADFWNGAYLGWWINPLSQMQEFALHVAIIPLIIFALFFLHYLLERTYGIAKPYRSDIKYRMVAANHTVMYVRGVVLIIAIALLALVFPSPYVAPVRIADIARQNPALVVSALEAEYDRSSDTAVYLDSIDPYTFDTQQVYVVVPWGVIVGGPPTDPATMIQQLMPAAQSGLYESVLAGENPSINDTYTLRFLNDMNALEEKAGTLNFATEQWGMAKDENGHFVAFPPGSWWFLPLALLNSAFDLPNNPNGDRIAAEALGLMMLVLIAFPYIPYLNRLPELLHLAPLIWREPR